MAILPLTHHDILEPAAPFARRGRQVDLAASNRLERRLLLFKSVDHPGEGGLPAIRETLELRFARSSPCATAMRYR